MKKTKIICTLGPSTDKDGVLEELVKEGMNVARFNFSHGLHDEQKGRIDKLKEKMIQVPVIYWILLLIIVLLLIDRKLKKKGKKKHENP